ncbi:hypothetical protein E2C01_068586 [Portunus trituberculatus]|uniref:Uncharacterized protein n=1 Tax=Portunus trituberculatus TaxID=210409 RepID=A0A5B7HWA7_PORTR|nr:hypothetical protein [Portunus trituberculatus]
MPASPAMHQFAPSCCTVNIAAPCVHRRFVWLLALSKEFGLFTYGGPREGFGRDAKALLLFLLLVLGQEKA